MPIFRRGGTSTVELSPLLITALRITVQAARAYDEFVQSDALVQQETQDETLRRVKTFLEILSDDIDRLKKTESELESKKPDDKALVLAHHFAGRITKYVRQRDKATLDVFTYKMSGNEKAMRAAFVDRGMYIQRLPDYCEMFLAELDTLEQKHPDLYQALDFPADLRSEIQLMASQKK